MTNKINGIDVSELVSSATNNNIYYSQIAVDELQNNIKRLQEENEKLRHKCEVSRQCVEMIKNTCGQAHKKGIELTKENEELKARLKTLDDEVLTIEITPDEFERYKKYKQVLEEIRNICKMDCGDCQYNQDCDCNFQECEEAKIDDILNTINEVFGNE